MTNEILDVQAEGVITAEVMKQPDTVATGQVGLFPAAETEDLRNRWHDIQGSFVDEPKQSVQRADELVASVIQRLVEVFALERAKLETDWGKQQDTSTENLRLSLKRYRSFFDRLLLV